MNGVFGRLLAFVLGALLALPVASQNVLIFAPDPFIGEFVQPSSSFALYAGPGTQFERVATPAVERGKRVRIVAATADRRWYRVRWRETRESEPLAGWAEARHFIVRGRKSEIGDLLRDERREARAQSREEMAATGAETGAIRAERERQRAALDRMREKTEALKQAEDRQRETAQAAAAGTRLSPAQEEAEREQAARERAAWQSARDAAAQRERERQQAEARQREEAERERLEQTRREAAERAAREEQARAQAALRFLAALYGAFLLLPGLPLYRAYIEYRARHLREWSPAGGIALSALCGLSAAALAWGVGTDANPWFVFAAGLLGLPAWFFGPGLLWLLLVFLHSLFVPHPNEALFERVLRGEPLSRAEAEQVTRAMYDARRDGMPADWRVRGRMWRLERLAALLEKEKAFAEKMAENAMK